MSTTNKSKLYFRGTSRPEVFPIGGDGKQSYNKLESPRRIRDLQKSKSFLPSWFLGTNGNVNNFELEILECWRYNHRSKKYGDLSVGNGMTKEELEILLNKKIDKYLKTILKKGYLIKKENNRLYSQTARGVAGKVGFAFLTKKNTWSPTITASTLSEQAHFDGTKIRRLTPKECERLQGFPDDWTKTGVKIFRDFEKDGMTCDISNSQRYKMTGNAVTVNVIKEIMLKLIK